MGYKPVNFQKPRESAILEFAAGGGRRRTDGGIPRRASPQELKEKRSGHGLQLGMPVRIWRTTISAGRTAP